MSSESHDEFLELSALSASGELTQQQKNQLEQHLGFCASCREAAQEFEALVGRVIPGIGAEQTVDDLERDSSSASAWSVEAADKVFFRRLANEEECAVQAEEGGFRASSSAIVGASLWRDVWTSYAVAILLIISLGFTAYQLGSSRHPLSPKPPLVVQSDTQNQSRFQQETSDLRQEREKLCGQIAQKDELIGDLKRHIKEQLTELRQIRVALAEAKNDESVRRRGQDSAQQATDLASKLETAQAEVQALRAKLDSLVPNLLSEKARQDENRATLQAKVDDLTRMLENKKVEAQEQQELLAHDRDIRELMGARDLYMTEVYDLAHSGETQKPFGRVFYTREKSLIFYAYDLNQEAGLKNAGSFQAWGRRGSDRSQSLNLGIFYEDNKAKERWVLKFNDAKTLAQIDAIFVTTEPNGGSRKPSGKPLLFAYLKMDPNHP